MQVREALEEIAQAAGDLILAVESFMEPRSKFPWQQGMADFRKMATVVCIRRQIEAIQAILNLVDHDLGHMGAVFLRPACEELLWLSYLENIPKEDAQAVITALSIYDGSRGIAAQREYVGDSIMEEIEFPVAFLQFNEALQAKNAEALSSLQVRLNWPRSGRPGPPPTSWIAKQSTHESIYKFLFSATSRSVHFSAGEVARRIWGDGGKSGAPLEFASPIHILYRSRFCVYWSCDLLIRTLTSTANIIFHSEASQNFEGDEEAYESAVKRIASHGKVPLVIPEEFNIPKIARD